MDKVSLGFEAAAADAIPGQGGFDYLIVGAGFAGSVLAERLARELGMRVLIVDKRPHIGGNAYDRYDDAGVLIHPYGPHVRTSTGCWRASTARTCRCRSISTPSIASTA